MNERPFAYCWHCTKEIFVPEDLDCERKDFCTQIVTEYSIFYVHNECVDAYHEAVKKREEKEKKRGLGRWMQ